MFDWSDSSFIWSAVIVVIVNPRFVYGPDGQNQVAATQQCFIETHTPWFYGRRDEENISLFVSLSENKNDKREVTFPATSNVSFETILGGEDP